jgi:hypothetical protein
MNIITDKKYRILIVDSDNYLGQTLAEKFRSSGHAVTTHSRQENNSYPVNFTSKCIANEIEKLSEQGNNFNRVIFGLKNYSESFETIEDIVRTQDEIDTMLMDLKSVSQSLIRSEQSQIWVLLPEDSMTYYLPISSQPVRSRALMAAVKSLAKEIFPFDVKLNALQIQPVFEQLDNSIWKDAKANLKAYAIKFKPQKCVDIANMINSLISISVLPMAGLIIPVGVGYPEMNI